MSGFLIFTNHCALCTVYCALRLGQNPAQRGTKPRRGGTKTLRGVTKSRQGVTKTSRGGTKALWGGTKVGDFRDKDFAGVGTRAPNRKEKNFSEVGEILLSGSRKMTPGFAPVSGGPELRGSQLGTKLKKAIRIQVVRWSIISSTPRSAFRIPHSLYYCKNVALF